MAFESFYGGRPGASLVIVTQYASKQEMIDNFLEGGNSTSRINYGEYAVINNKIDPDHGNVYRRGVNYAHVDSRGIPDGGAEYIGNMAGPKGEPGGIHIIGLVRSTADVVGHQPEYWGEEYKGWVMAVETHTEAQTDIPDLYAYDYINEEWFYLGNLPYAPYVITRRTVEYDDIA